MSKISLYRLVEYGILTDKICFTSPSTFMVIFLLLPLLITFDLFSILADLAVVRHDMAIDN